MKMKKNNKNKSKRIIALALIFMFILPVLNFGVIHASAATNYLTVDYTSSHKDFEEAYGANDKEVRILTITGNGELTLADCRFITENLSVLSINFTDARFKNNKVPDGAFKEFYELVSLALPSSVTEIGKEAFHSCVSLKSIGFTSNLKIIGDRAFYRCFRLENIALPAMVAKIGENAFAECDSIVTVLALSNNGSTYNAAANAFSGIPAKCVLVTPVNSKGYDKAPFSHLTKTEWKFYSLPANSGVAAGTDFSIPVDITGADDSKAAYQWYRDGYEIHGETGDTLVISNISPEYSGRYMVAVTIKNTRALFSCIIDVNGINKGETKISSKNTAPDHKSEPEKTKYDYIQRVDAHGKAVGEIEISPIAGDKKEFTNPGKFKPLTYIAYTKKIKELYDKDKTGRFYFHITDYNSEGGVEIPFGIINSAKNIDLTKDNQIRIQINESGGRYSVYIAITDENGKVLYDFKDAHNLPGAYMYLPHENKDYMIRIDEAINELRSLNAYPVPSVKSGNMLKFKIQNNFLYSRQIPASAAFTDIKNHWGEKDIINSAKNLIVNGYPDKSFKPDGVLTRAEFSAMLTRVLYHKLVWEPAKIKKYGDVKSSDWFGEFVGIADVMGLTGFVTGPDFKPNQEITREEMAFMIKKAADYALPGVSVAQPMEMEMDYKDIADIDAKYLSSVEFCTNAGLLRGTDGKFLPKRTLTRAEAATVLNRLLDLLAKDI